MTIRLVQRCLSAFLSSATLVLHNCENVAFLIMTWELNHNTSRSKFHFLDFVGLVSHATFKIFKKVRRKFENQCFAHL